MRKATLLLLVFIITLSFTGLAQQRVKFDREWFIGAKGGAAASQMRFYPNVNQQLLLGPSVGVVGRFISEPNVGLQIEVNYVQGGWNELPFEKRDAVADDNAYKHFSYTRNLNYIKVPIMTHVNIGKKRTRFFFNVGPSISFLLDESESYNMSIVDIPEELQEYLFDYYGVPVQSKVDFQFAGGLGLEVRQNNGNAFALETRVYFSLPNIFDVNSSDFKNLSAAQNQSIELTLSYQFDLGKKKK